MEQKTPQPVQSTSTPHASSNGDGANKPATSTPAAAPVVAGLPSGAVVVAAPTGSVPVTPTPAATTTTTAKAECHTGNVLVFTVPVGKYNLRIHGGGRMHAAVYSGIDVLMDVGAIETLPEIKVTGPGFNRITKLHTGTTLKLTWPDGTAPSYDAAFWQSLILDLKDFATKKDASVLVSCQGGHGRTGTALTIIGCLLGLIPEKNEKEEVVCPVTWLREHYCHEAVEREAQLRYVEKMTGRKVTAEPEKTYTTSYGNYTYSGGYQSGYQNGYQAPVTELDGVKVGDEITFVSKDANYVKYNNLSGVVKSITRNGTKGTYNVRMNDSTGSTFSAWRDELTVTKSVPEQPFLVGSRVVFNPTGSFGITHKGKVGTLTSIPSVPGGMFHVKFSDGTGISATKSELTHYVEPDPKAPDPKYKPGDRVVFNSKDLTGKEHNGKQADIIVVSETANNEIVYDIKFDDGVVHDAYEDELTIASGASTKDEKKPEPRAGDRVVFNTKFQNYMLHNGEHAVVVARETEPATYGMEVSYIVRFKDGTQVDALPSELTLISEKPVKTEEKKGGGPTVIDAVTEFFSGLIS